MDEKIKELTLMRLYLTSWEEKEMGVQYQRSWKGYDFDVLNTLADEELVMTANAPSRLPSVPMGWKKQKNYYDTMVYQIKSQCAVLQSEGCFYLEEFMKKTNIIKQSEPKFYEVKCFSI